ncbi:MAG: MFS transporter [Chthoniobacteraceae bacterium]
MSDPLTQNRMPQLCIYPKRWRIAALLSTGIAIFYFDRQTLGVALKSIEQTIPISPEQYGWLTSAFLITYAFAYVAAGKLLDTLGTRRGFFIMVLCWAAACASHGLATTFSMLLMSRLFLGIGEGGGFPAASKAIAEWFPSSERSTAMGIINAGSAVGGVIAAPGIALILALAKWPWVFFTAALTGILWTAWWLIDYRFPKQSSPRDERNELLPSSSEQPIPWCALLRYRQLWALMSAKFLTDAAWFFYVFWLPKYLYSERGFDIKSMGCFAWIPFAAAGFGCLAGGGASSFLMHRGVSLDRARKLIMGLSAALMPFILFTTASPIAIAIGLFALAYFGHQAWSTLLITLPADIFPRSTVGSVAGMVGFGGAMGGVVFNLLVGYMLGHGFEFKHIFMISGTLHVIGFGLVLLGIRKIQPLTFSPGSVMASS